MGAMKKRDILLGLISGILLILSFPNFDLEFLAWFALVPLFYSIEGKGSYHSFILGFLTGVISFLGILYWIIVAVHTYGNVPLIPSGFILLFLVAYLSLYHRRLLIHHSIHSDSLRTSNGALYLLFSGLLWNISALSFSQVFPGQI